MSVVEGALADLRASELFAAISKQIAVEFRLASGLTWGSNLESPGKAVIRAAASSMPAAALAHELLHLSTQLLGYRRLRVTASLTESPEFRSRLVPALDNELQHHRMFVEYIRRGFPSSCFYADHDRDIESYLRKEIGEHTSFRDLLVPFLSLIAPGGQLRSSSRRKLRRAFAEAEGGVGLLEVERIFKAWSDQPDLDAEASVREIFRLLDPDSRTWLGYGEERDFPRNGFFVGQSFAVPPTREGPSEG
jgi:hypothetical protein